jgi:hypothetical protein
MATDRYKAYATLASDELDHKQDMLVVNHGIGTFADFIFDQTTGKLAFKDARGRVCVEAEVTPLGTFSSPTKTWRWSWANESFVPTLRQKAEILKKLRRVTDKDYFEKPSLRASEKKAWELAAVCVRYLRSVGCYRVPTERLYVFLALDKIVAVAPKKAVVKKSTRPRK